MPTSQRPAHGSVPAIATAEAFEARLWALQSDEELRKIGRYFKSGPGQYGEGDRFIGVRMKGVFELAEEFILMSPGELERLLESDIHEARVGALSIMARQYGRGDTSPERRQELFDLYLRRHDRINNWDLVDLAAWHVIGPHLVARNRDVLYRLAGSANPWERRTSIYATYAFLKRGDCADTLAIAELLLDDPEDLIHKAAGGMLRVVGDKDRGALFAFLDRHAARMPRVMLRYAIEKLGPEDRQRYLGQGRARG